jgi:hypothetical protein
MFWIQQFTTSGKSKKWPTLLEDVVDLDVGAVTAAGVVVDLAEAVARRRTRSGASISTRVIHD